MGGNFQTFGKTGENDSILNPKKCQQSHKCNVSDASSTLRTFLYTVLTRLLCQRGLRGRRDQFRWTGRNLLPFPTEEDEDPEGRYLLEV